MASPIRNFQIDFPYHVYNRGNRKSEIFLSARDYQRFLKRLGDYKKMFNIELFCYCLMPNHFHLLIRQKSEGTITKFMLRLCTSYSKYFNVKYELVGRLFQERFKAKIVETDEYLLQLSRYVHLNPISDDLEELKFQLGLTPGVEANKMHQKLISYPWSSYKEYVEGIKGICDKKFLLDYFSKQQPNKSYASFVEAGTTEQEQQLLTPFL